MKKDTPNLGKVIEIDETRIKDHLGELVSGSVGWRTTIMSVPIRAH